MNEQANKPTSIRTQAVYLTDTGQSRAQNQDFVALEIPGRREALRAKGALYLLADGMGGYRAGDVASRQTAETVTSAYYADPQTDVAKSLTQAVQAANLAVYESALADPRLTGMGTTVVAAIVRDDKLYLANVGDSRAYLLRGKKFRQITKDHSLVQEQIDADIISAEAARIHPQRNIITRALGHQPQLEADIFQEQLLPGDILLLCSDGLSGPLRDEEMADILRQHPLSQAVVRLIEAANERGGPDNISALLVQALPAHPSRASAIQLAPGAPPDADAPTGPLETPVWPSAAPAPAGKPEHSIVRSVLGVALLVAAIVVTLFALSANDEQSAMPTLAATIAPLPQVEPTRPDSSQSQDQVTPPTLEPTPTPAGSLCQLLLPALVAPPQGASLPPGDVTFQWQGGQLCPGYVWRVSIDGQTDLCAETTANQVVCSLLPGEHQWSLKIWNADGLAVPGLETAPWSLNVSASPQP
jgi:protein phosphatase